MDTDKNQVNVKGALDKVLAFMSSEDGLKAAALAIIPPVGNLPSNTWSLSNRLIMLASGTADARGFNQWKAAGRHVKKGSHAIYILAPRIIKKDTGEQDKSGDPIIEHRLIGFLGIPVFTVEETEGVPLPEIQLPPPPPLLDVATKWGINVKYAPFLGSYYGYYSNRGNGEKRIMLNTPDIKVFFHELAHAAHDRLKGGLKGGQNPEQEIVAEFASAVLTVMYVPDYPNLPWAREYIAGYAAARKMNAGAACVRLLGETEKVLAEIVNAAAVISDKAA